ncbi:MAG: hypothetical protein WCW34_04780 [Patescibacteria group bacterium]
MSTAEQQCTCNSQVDQDLVAFVRKLDGDGLAAVELLGELPTKEREGRQVIGIPKSHFPIPEVDREGFYINAQEIGLLRPVGVNPEHGVLEQVWELNVEVYERALEAMTTLGCISPRVSRDQSEATSEDVDEAVAPSELVAGPLATEPEIGIPELREKLSAAKTERASAQAESSELRAQYSETVGTINAAIQSISEIQARIEALHAHRLALKRRVKCANVAYSDACYEAKRLSRQLVVAERQSLESLAKTAADILMDEAKRLGVPVEQVVSRMRKLLRPPEGNGNT